MKKLLLLFCILNVNQVLAQGSFRELPAGHVPYKTAAFLRGDAPHKIKQKRLPNNLWIYHAMPEDYGNYQDIPGVTYKPPYNLGNLSQMRKFNDGDTVQHIRYGVMKKWRSH